MSGRERRASAVVSSTTHTRWGHGLARLVAGGALAVALLGCALPMSCYDQCEADHNHCLDEITSVGQDFACQAQFDRCTSTCASEP